MKNDSLLPQLGIAAVLAVSAAVLAFVLERNFGATIAAKLILSLAVFAYLLWLQWRNRIVTGKVLLPTVNLAVIAGCFLSGIQAETLIFIYSALIWGNRMLMRRLTPFSALADLALCALTAAAMLRVLAEGYGIAASLWCLLLLQALHVMIPGRNEKQRSTGSINTADRFDSAYRTAESALQQLSKKL